jgi:hypothetical protein
MFPTSRPLPSPPSASARRSLMTAGAFAVALALSSAIAVVPAGAATARAAKLDLTTVAVKGTTVTVSGRVSLPSNTAKERKRAEVYLTIIGDTGTGAKAETFTAKLTSKDAFTAKHTTTLTGALGLDVVVKIGGKQSGKKIARTVSVTAPVSPGTGSTGGGSTGGGSTGGGSTGGGSTGGGSTGGGSTQGTALNGTFEFETGVEHPDGLITGTYFAMEGFSNNNSPFQDQDYTPLSAGTDGGLETFAYQGPPTPAFLEIVDGRETGNALANEIVQPQEFFGTNFSIVTAPTDLQEKLADPLPTIVDTNGKLSGQITDWTAQWNGESFNQGAPKANGTLPRYEGSVTTLPTGSYDAATEHYVLTWTSLIVGGPFDKFLGVWHLEGTFVPQA